MLSSSVPVFSSKTIVKVKLSLCVNFMRLHVQYFTSKSFALARSNNKASFCKICYINSHTKISIAWASITGTKALKYTARNGFRRFHFKDMLPNPSQVRYRYGSRSHSQILAHLSRGYSSPSFKEPAKWSDSETRPWNPAPVMHMVCSQSWFRNWFRIGLWLVPNAQLVQMQL